MVQKLIEPPHNSVSHNLGMTKILAIGIILCYTRGFIYEQIFDMYENMAQIHGKL